MKGKRTVFALVLVGIMGLSGMGALAATCNISVPNVNAVVHGYATIDKGTLLLGNIWLGKGELIGRERDWVTASVSVGTDGEKSNALSNYTLNHRHKSKSVTNNVFSRAKKVTTTIKYDGVPRECSDSL